MQTLFLRKNCERRLKSGHLWVFSNEVDTRRSPLASFAPGQEAQVASADGSILGSAYVNPLSLIAARLFSRRPGTSLDAHLLRARLEQALHLRSRLFPLPFYRLCHGEGDFLPGLVLDRHGQHLVMQAGTAGMEKHLEELLEILRDMFHPETLFLRNNLAGRQLEGLEPEDKTLIGSPPEEMLLEENGLSYRAPLARGQKTGWFYDQRLNRAALIPFAPGARVLDAFCYAGGFGALAARHGAASVTFIDSSAPALELAARNALEASLLHGRRAGVEILRGEALETLAELRRAGERFSLVCLDPPAFIKRRKDAAAGLEAYRRINELGLDLVEEGGFLLTSSCSHHLESAALEALVGGAAARRGRFLRRLFHGFQSPDHPVHPAMPETAYLKAYLFQAN
jgi:23S rRNA (cytosine1962-C5)-methyltransferase